MHKLFYVFNEAVTPCHLVMILQSLVNVEHYFFQLCTQTNFYQYITRFRLFSVRFIYFQLLLYSFFIYDLQRFFIENSHVAFSSLHVSALSTINVVFQRLFTCENYAKC